MKQMGVEAREPVSYTVALSSEQTDALNETATSQGVTRSQIIEEVFRAYLGSLPSWDGRKPKAWRGRAKPARRGGKIIHKFTFSPEQSEKIDEAVDGHMSFARFFESAMQADFKQCFHREWPEVERPDLPWGRPREIG